MILCVCPSPAVDVTYHGPGLVVGGSNRVERVLHRAGGKGVNVARLLHGLGVASHVLAPVGGAAGEEVRAGLAADGVEATLVPTRLPTRRTVTYVAPDTQATILLEPAEVDCWSEVAHAYERLLDRADVVVISGSFPLGADPQAPADLVVAARRAGRPVLVDTSGPALRLALEAGPSLVKPNAHELAEVGGDDDPASAARRVAKRYGTTVVASLGPDGVVVAGPAGDWAARPGRVVSGNPTGAGDALVAALARGVATGVDLSGDLTVLLRDSVALSAAAVLSPWAGEVDATAYDDQLLLAVVTGPGATR